MIKLVANFRILVTPCPLGDLLEEHTDDVWSVAITPDGQRVVLGSDSSYTCHSEHTDIYIITESSILGHCP
jgi:hypothetical protein